MLQHLRSLLPAWASCPRNRVVASAHRAHPNSSSPGGRGRHPREARCIRPEDYGRLPLHVHEGPRGIFSSESTPTLALQDLYAHVIVFGESGSGKTYYVLNQLLEQLFQSTHLNDGPDREAKKIGGLVIEAKGDFTPKVWSLAQKYGRMEDIIFFGPDHLDQAYDMFGDPSETPPQLADKMMQLLVAFGGGKKSEDPFWDNAARKLFTHLFLLHRALSSERSNETPPMSFALLNLLILDRGQPHNQGEVDADRQHWEKCYGSFQSELKGARSLLLPLQVTLQGLQVRSRNPNPLYKQAGLDLSSAPAPDSSPENAGNLASGMSRSLHGLLFDDLEGDAHEPLLATLQRLLEHIEGFLQATDDAQRGEHYHSIIEEAGRLRASVPRQLAALQSLSSSQGLETSLLESLSRGLLDLLQHLSGISDLGQTILQWTPVAPEWGKLREWVERYGESLRQQGRKPWEDSIYSYFHEEYLNVVNDKTSGSVGMLASNLVSLFVHPPFDRIFSARPTFSMARVVDEGKIIVLDMPSAFHGSLATIAALVLKIDFFRSMLSRPRMTVAVSAQDPSGSRRRVNQERPMTYFCDEFATVASRGDTTGEAGFLDKVREYRCCCILGLQSLPMLLKKFPEAEVDAILTNCATKIFLRNSDPRTNEMAAKVMGQQFKVSLNRGHTPVEMALNMEMPIGKEGFTTSYSLGNRVEPTEFCRLPDGVAQVRLNPRFGAHQLRRIAFRGHSIYTPDPNDIFPLPICLNVEELKVQEPENHE